MTNDPAALPAPAGSPPPSLPLSASEGMFEFPAVMNVTYTPFLNHNPLPHWFYKVDAARNPDRARVPTDHLEEFKTRPGASPGIWQIEGARACAPEARDVVPPAHAPSPPPSGSQPEQGDSTTEVRTPQSYTQCYTQCYTRLVV